MIIIDVARMFSISENWTIKDLNGNSSLNARQLYDIYDDVRSCLMIDFVNPFSTLRWHIDNLEEKLNDYDNSVNGSTIETTIPFFISFETSGQFFPNDAEFGKAIASKIKQMHALIDEIGTLMPLMLKRYHQLKEKRLNLPIEHVETEQTYHNGMLTLHGYTFIEPVNSDDKSLNPVCRFTTDPILTLYHIADNLPPDPENPDDPDNYCDTSCW